MSQIMVGFSKTLKEFLRQKIVVFWTIAWPSIWVVLSSFSFLSSVPTDIISFFKGSYTISMTMFALMFAGIANLPGNIATDRERRLLSKLKSMPISPWKDFAGRILALLAFSLLAAVFVVLVGVACGANFLTTIGGFLQSIGYVLLLILASTGIGLIIGTLIKHVQGVITLGVGISTLTASISGVFAPYSVLPTVLQNFAKVYPISSVNSSVIYLLEGENYAGYNPLEVGQITLTITLSLSLFIIGLILYSKICWKEE